MKRYISFLAIVFLLFVFVSCGYALVKKPSLKEDPEEGLKVRDLAESGSLQPEKDMVLASVKLAADFKLQDLKSDTVTLNSFRDKKPVILFFWTTWCPYCLKNLKEIIPLSDELEKDGIELLLINIGEPASRVERFLERNNLDVNVFLDERTDVAGAYEIYGVPTYVLIDKKGYIVNRSNSFPHRAYKELISQ